MELVEAGLMKSILVPIFVVAFRIAMGIELAFIAVAALAQSDPKQSQISLNGEISSVAGSDLSLQSNRGSGGREAHR